MSFLLLESGGKLLLGGGGKLLLEQRPPALPAVVTGVYYVRLDDGSPTGDGQTVPWDSIATANAATASFGAAPTTVNYWGGDIFLCPSGGGLSVKVQMTVQSFGVGRAIVQANHNTSWSPAPLAVDMGGAHYASFLNMEIVGDGGDTIYGIHGSGTNVTIAGNDISGFYSPVSSGIGACIHTAATPGLQILDNRIGGKSGPTDPDDNGIILDYTMIGPTDSPIRILRNRIENIGTKSPTGGAVAQVGFGIHVGGVVGAGSPTPLLYTNGDPTNFTIEIAYNEIDGTGYREDKCGGCSAIEWQGDRGWEHHNKISNIGPPTWAGGCDKVGSDIDQGASNILIDREYFYRCLGPGWQVFVDSSPGWGNHVVRYCLAVECGHDSYQGASAVEGNGNTGGNGVFCFNNTTVGGSGNLFSLPACYNLANGFAANNNFVAGPSGSVVWADYGIGAFKLANNNWFGSSFTWPASSATPYSTYAAWKAGGAGSDQTGISADPLFVGGAGMAAYKLGTGSPCRGTGVDVRLSPYNMVVPATDIFGDAIGFGPLNIGA